MTRGPRSPRRRRPPPLGSWHVKVLCILDRHGPGPVAFRAFNGHASGKRAPVLRLLRAGLVVATLADVQTTYRRAERVTIVRRRVRALVLTDAGRAQVAAVRLLLAARPELRSGDGWGTYGTGPLAARARVPLLYGPEVDGAPVDARAAFAAAAPPRRPGLAAAAPGPDPRP